MTDSNDPKLKVVESLPSNVVSMTDDFEAAIERVRKEKPTGALILYTYEHASEPNVEAIGIQYTGSPTFKDFCAMSFALQTFIGREYK